MTIKKINAIAIIAVLSSVSLISGSYAVTNEDKENKNMMHSEIKEMRD